MLDIKNIILAEEDKPALDSLEAVDSLSNFDLPEKPYENATIRQVNFNFIKDC